MNEQKIKEFIEESNQRFKGSGGQEMGEACLKPMQEYLRKSMLEGISQSEMVAACGAVTMAFMELTKKILDDDETFLAMTEYMTKQIIERDADEKNK